MAKVTKNVVPDPPYTVTIELSQEEAEKLFWVTGKMRAWNDSTSGLFYGLRNAGVNSVQPKVNPFPAWIDTAPFTD